MIYQLDSGQIMLEFGHGDIIVSAQYLDDDDFAYVGFIQANDTYQIGDMVTTKSGESNIPNIVMAFDKIESIDVVMNGLQLVRKRLASKNNADNGDKTD